MKIGVHDIPFEQYRVEPGVNQSSLKRMARSPAHFRHYVDNPQKPTRPQILGTIFHTAVLQPHLLEDSYCIRPDTYTGKKGETKPWNGNATECREWLEARDGNLILKREENDTIILMRNYVVEHPAAKAALAEGKSEQSLFATDPETGVPIKCRLDHMSGTAVIELKSCEDASPVGFARAVANFSYDLQAAYGLFICDLLGLNKSAWIFIAVESSEPYAVGVYCLDEASIDIGRSKFRRLLNRFAECDALNNWPAYSPNIEYLSIPKWAASSEFAAQLLDDRPAQPALEVAKVTRTEKSCHTTLQAQAFHCRCGQ